MGASQFSGVTLYAPRVVLGHGVLGDYSAGSFRSLVPRSLLFLQALQRFKGEGVTKETRPVDASHRSSVIR